MVPPPKNSEDFYLHLNEIGRYLHEICALLLRGDLGGCLCHVAYICQEAALPILRHCISSLANGSRPYGLESFDKEILYVNQ